MNNIVKGNVPWELNLTNDELIELVNNSSVNFDIKKLEKLRKEDDEKDEGNRPLILRKNKKIRARGEVQDLMSANFDNVFALLEFLKKERDRGSFKRDRFDAKSESYDAETTQMIRDLLDKVINELESFINDQLSQKTVKFNMKTVDSHMWDFFSNMTKTDPDLQVKIDDTNNASECFLQQLREMREKIAVKDELKECA